MGDAKHNEGGFSKLDSYEKEERPKGKESGPPAIMWVIWKERNKGAFLKEWSKLL